MLYTAARGEGGQVLMEVILLQDVKALGKAGEIKKVSDGYARNYLLPQRLASPVTPGAVKDAESRLKNEVRRQEKVETEASNVAAALSKVTLKFKAKSGEKGRLYGSITAGDIVETLERETGRVIDKRKVLLDEPIRQLGVHRVGIKLPTGLTPEIEVIVESEE